MILRQLGAAIARIDQSWRSQPTHLPKFSSFYETSWRKQTYGS